MEIDVLIEVFDLNMSDLCECYSKNKIFSIQILLYLSYFQGRLYLKACGHEPWH